MQVNVDMTLCEGHGVCVLAAPSVFDLDDEDNLIVLDERPDHEAHAAVREAMNLCPKRAIAIVA